MKKHRNKLLDNRGSIAIPSALFLALAIIIILGIYQIGSIYYEKNQLEIKMDSIINSIQDTLNKHADEDYSSDVLLRYIHFDLDENNIDDYNLTLVYPYQNSHQKLKITLDKYILGYGIQTTKIISGEDE
ncbi:hypothetical protein JK182_01495 [Acetobacter okinawensis]|uniref:hypothetical protein n=1 Tax=Acetobacter okinawensis TaxID=1076594 RepID=UPI001BA61AB2|nr:hypothetical protein [Acetobacter okinawensis]MBS0987366.1 hypothetical protein [Acetobacter okinawensis]